MIIRKKSKQKKSRQNEIQTKISAYFTKKPISKSKRHQKKHSVNENINYNYFGPLRKSSKNTRPTRSRDKSCKTQNFNMSRKQSVKNQKSVGIFCQDEISQFKNRLRQQAEKKHKRIKTIYNSNSNLIKLCPINQNYVHCSTRNPQRTLSKSKSIKQLKSSQSRQALIKKIKKNDIIDPQFCQENQFQIFKYLSKKQSKQINSDFILFRKQPDITLESRNYMFEWISELAENFKLLDKTLFITLDVLDIYLNVYKVSKYSLQLLAISVLFSFSKHEEIYPPTVNDYLSACNYKYRQSDVYEVEAEIFDLLQYDLNRVTVLDFYLILSKSIGFNAEQNNFGINIFKMCYKYPEIQTNSKSLLAFSVCHFLCRVTKHIYLHKKRIGQRVYFYYEENNLDLKSTVILKEAESDVKYLSLQIENKIEKFLQIDINQKLFSNCLKEIDLNQCKGNYFCDFNAQQNLKVNQLIS